MNQPHPIQADVTVIGGGPSGYAAAMRALDFGKRVVLIEKGKLGGAGIHDGALSSKTLWEISREFELIARKSKAMNLPAPRIAWKDVKEEVEAAVRQREQQLTQHLIRLRDYEETGQLTYLCGTGSMISPNEVQVVNGGIHLIRTDYIVLATGSRPRLLPGVRIDEQSILTSDGVSQLKDFPRSMVILGAGVIGCEFASIFANFGQTKVYLIDKAERILPFEDADLSQRIQSNMEKMGIVVHGGARLIRMDILPDGWVEYEVEYTGGEREINRVEKALVSIGRVPNSENLNLAAAGVQVDERLHIVTHESRTTTENIFAVGDLTADIALVNVGELEGRHAIESIWGKTKPLCYDNISTIMFLSPEVAGVGMNELQAQARGIAYQVVSVDYGCISRAIAMRSTDGFFKILVEKNTQRILGMRAMGEHASTAIQAVALLISMGKDIGELAELIHPHPSIVEGIQECARMLAGKSIFKPEAMGGMMRFSEWIPDENK